MNQRENGKFRKGMSGFLGRKHTKETRIKMSKNSPKFWQGKHFLKEHKDKISKSNIGKKLNFIPIGAFKKGISHNKGKEHWAWKGGICESKIYLSWIKNKRNRMLRGVFPKHTFQEWENLMKKFEYRCAICGKIKPLTIDHVIPISKVGTDDIENIQPLCRSCNCKKYNKIYV